MIIYSDKVTGAHKIKLLPLAVANTMYKEDVGLKAHERQHIKQYCSVFFIAGLAGLFLFNWVIGLCAGILTHDALYTFVRTYRQWAEVNAFREQLKHGGSVELAARALVDNYDLDITYSGALILLQ